MWLVTEIWYKEGGKGVGFHVIWKWKKEILVAWAINQKQCLLPPVLSTQRQAQRNTWHCMETHTVKVKLLPQIPRTTTSMVTPPPLPALFCSAVSFCRLSGSHFSGYNVWVHRQCLLDPRCPLLSTVNCIGFVLTGSALLIVCVVSVTFGWVSFDKRKRPRRKKRKAPSWWSSTSYVSRVKSGRRISVQDVFKALWLLRPVFIDQVSMSIRCCYCCRCILSSRRSRQSSLVLIEGGVTPFQVPTPVTETERERV